MITQPEGWVPGVPRIPRSDLTTEVRKNVLQGHSEVSSVSPK